MCINHSVFHFSSQQSLDRNGSHARLRLVTLVTVAFHRFICLSAVTIDCILIHGDYFVDQILKYVCLYSDWYNVLTLKINENIFELINSVEKIALNLFCAVVIQKAMNQF